MEIEEHKLVYSEIRWVLQSSILGPLIFNLGMSMIWDLHPVVEILLFVDDTTIVVSESNTDWLYSRAKSLINSLFDCLYMCSLSVDWRVSCLVLFVKHWAKAQNINDASHGTISSYSLVLMVIHYLQCKCSFVVAIVMINSVAHWNIISV